MNAIQKLYDFKLIKTSGLNFLPHKVKANSNESLKLGLVYVVENKSKIKTLIQLLKLRVIIFLHYSLPSKYFFTVIDVHYIFPSMQNPTIIYSKNSHAIQYVEKNIFPQNKGLKKVIFRFIQLVIGISPLVAGVIVIKKINKASNA